MNNVSLTGRLTADPVVRYGGQDNATAIARFTLAVDDYQATDFISCKAIGKTAEWIEKWTKKGIKIELVGKIKSGSYEKPETGEKVYYTEVLANSASFAESKAAAESRHNDAPGAETGNAQRQQPEPQPSNGGFVNIPSGIDEELPFS